VDGGDCCVTLAVRDVDNWDDLKGPLHQVGFACKKYVLIDAAY
jgi:hypothetical protein